jgi:hypothetical protein
MSSLCYDLTASVKEVVYDIKVSGELAMEVWQYVR